MAGAIKHRFTSGKADGPDPTLLQPSHQNDSLIVSGGVHGQVFQRDTGAADGWSLITPSSGHGRCRLQKESANLVLRPFNGTWLIIEDTAQSVPDGGVSLAATGLVAGTTYFLYAYMDAGTMKLEASTTTHARDATTGVEIKSGDRTRTLVGQARVITGPAWADTSAQRFVRSWFNRPPIAGENVFTADRSTASTTWVELNTEIRVEVLLWPDEVVSVNATGAMSANGIAGEVYVKLSVDGGTAEDGGSVGDVADEAGAWVPIATSIEKSGLAEGYHYFTVLGQAQSTFTSTYLGQAGTGLRTHLKLKI